jgi:two-component system phosphate regulon sensor histidine kinase PhoR
VKFRSQLLATHVGLVAAVIVGTVFALNRSLGADLSRRLDRRLEEQARGASAWVGAGRHPERVAQRLADVVDARVTVFDSDGGLLGDSAHAVDKLADAAPDAKDQPELAAALAGRVGRSIRRAADTGIEMQYVAVPGDEGIIGRLGVPLGEIRETLAAMRLRLLLTSALALLAALALALVAARVAVRPLRAMTAAAARIAKGDYRIDLPPTANDEFGELARSLGSLAGQLEARIGDLTAERDRLSAILAGMVEGVLVVAADERLIVANPSAARILAATGGLAKIADVPHAGVRVILGDALASGSPVEREVDGGGAGLLTINVRPLATAAGGGVVAVLHDVTRLRRLETMRRDFIANASHELRTPVTAIQGCAETLIGGADAATQKEFLEIIHRHARRIGRLVEDLLRLSELEARPPESARREVLSVSAVARVVTETLRARAAAAGQTVVVDVAAELEARGDPAGLEQVLENLVDNAVKYGRGKGGTITLRAGRVAPDRVKIDVVDDGNGIAAEHLPRLFERFYRVDPSRAGASGGTGLGLAIVKHLAEAMGGRVSVESQVGKGTTFTIDLPAS